MHYKPSGSCTNNKSLKCISDTQKGVLISLEFNNGILKVSVYQHFNRHDCLISFFPLQSSSVPQRVQQEY